MSPPRSSPTLRWSSASRCSSKVPAGVGKTELAKALARATGRELIRLQCYEGLHEAKALYEWNYRKQLLRIEATGEQEAWEDIFTDDFLLTRPLMQAIASPEPVVLLIDEIDKTDQEFRGHAAGGPDFQISIPELGVIESTTHPVVVLTSNKLRRELTEALKRRCLYLWLDYPEIEREMEIVRLHAPELDEALTRRLVEVIHMIRQLDMKSGPRSPSRSTGHGRCCCSAPTTSTAASSSGRCRSSSSTGRTSTWSPSASA